MDRYVVREPRSGTGKRSGTVVDIVLYNKILT